MNLEKDDIPSVNAINVLKEYEGPNPYIQYLSHVLKQKGDINLSSNQEKYVLNKKDVEPVEVGKVIEINDYLGGQLKESEELSFTPERIYFDKIVSDNEKTYLILGKLKRNQKKNLFYWIPKKGVIDDPYWEEPDIQVDFDRYYQIDQDNRYPYDFQQEGIKFLIPRKGAILADDMGLGKRVADDIPVLTPNGWVNHGSLKPGDYVIGSDGNPTKVVNTYPSESDDYYKITFTDGSTVETCGEHLWSVQTPSRKKRGSDYINLTVNQMISNDTVKFSGSGYNKSKRYKLNTYYKFKNGDCKWYIPMVEPVNFNEREVKIDPYLLGVLLGDGSLIKKNISFSNKDEELIKEIDIRLPKNTKISEHHNEKDYRIITENKVESNKLTKNLEFYSLINTKSDTKFVPSNYKYNSINIRLELLQGLLDTDGYCSKKDGTIQYYSVSEKLCDDVRELVQSLGGVARKNQKRGKYKDNSGNHINCKKCYVLTINLPENITPFKLTRKIKNMKGVKKYHPSRGIKNIEYSRRTSGQCISVESKDNLYVIDEYAVTHNTFMTTIASFEVEPEKVLIICPAGMKISWQRELESFGVEDSKILYSKNWDEAKYTIVNYDILKNFHTPFNDRKKLKNKGEEVADNIMNAGFDMVIVDEAHYIKNHKSIRGQIVREVCAESPTVKRTWLLTGTPITNKPMDYFNLLRAIGSELANNWMFFAKRYCNAFQMNITRKNGKKQKIWKTDGASNLEELAKKTKNILIRRTKEDNLDLPDKTITPVVNELTKEEWKEYDRLWDDYVQKQKEKKKNEKKHEEQVEDEIEMQKDLVELTLLRQFIAEASVKHTIELTENILDQNDKNKVVIFTSYDQEQKLLADHFGKTCVTHNGKMTDKKKQKSIDDFQGKKSKKVFIGNINSAGVGITLTASNYMIFNSFSWTPGDNEQAEDRSFRIGQTNNVTVYYQLFKNTISEYMWGVLKDKKDIINKLLNEDKNEYKLLKDYLNEEKDE